MRTLTIRTALVGGLGALALVTAGCGDSDDTETATDTTAVIAETKTVTAVDYKFENLPSSVKAGTTLTLKNGSPKEVHELVVARLPDNEKRPVADLVRLPRPEFEALFQGPPTMVLIAPPGGAPQITAVGDGKLTEKGRYLATCFIPTGADPAAFLQAAQAAQDGPPAEVPGGPPHIEQGMYGEITVT